MAIRGVEGMAREQEAKPEDGVAVADEGLRGVVDEGVYREWSGGAVSRIEPKPGPVSGNQNRTNRTAPRLAKRPGFAPIQASAASSVLCQKCSTIPLRYNSPSAL